MPDFFPIAFFMCSSSLSCTLISRFYSHFLIIDTIADFYETGRDAPKRSPRDPAKPDRTAKGDASTRMITHRGRLHPATGSHLPLEDTVLRPLRSRPKRLPRGPAKPGSDREGDAWPRSELRCHDRAFDHWAPCIRLQGHTFLRKALLCPLRSHDAERCTRTRWFTLDNKNL